MIAFSRRLQGFVFALVGVIFITPDTMLLRKTESLPLYEVLFWRLLFCTIVLFVFLLCQTYYTRFISSRTRTESTQEKSSKKSSFCYDIFKAFSMMTRYGWAASIIYAIANVCFVFAVQNTYAANVLVILSTSSLFSAILSYFLLGERLKIHTIIACIISTAAILLILSDTIFKNKDLTMTSIFTTEQQVFGNVMALLVAIGNSFYYTALRFISIYENANADNTAINIIACGAVVIFTLFMKDNGVTRMDEGDISIMMTRKSEIFYLCMQGLLSLPISYTLLMFASSILRSAEVSIIMTLEVALGPLWVKLAGFEDPPRFTIYGGIIIILTLLVHEAINLKEERQTLTLTPDVSHSFVELTHIPEESSKEKSLNICTQDALMQRNHCDAVQVENDVRNCYII